MRNVVPMMRSLVASRSLATALAAAFALCVLSGCEANRELHDFPNDRVWESAHFRYHTRADDASVCEGVLVQLERHFELLRTYLGLSWPEGKKVDYYKFRDRADYLKNSLCPKSSGSCTAKFLLRSPYVLQEHELIHAYLATVGLPPLFFTEGAAVVLSCDSPYTERWGTSAWQDEVTSTANDTGDLYKTGGWFVGYLMDHYGLAPFLALYGRLGEFASVEDVAAIFQEIYGETLDAAWGAATVAGTRVGCVNLWACQGSALVLDGSPQSLVEACDGSDNTRTFTLDVPTDLVMSDNATPYDAPILCGSTRFVGVTSRPTGIAAWATLAHVNAGQYFVRAADIGISGTIPIRALPANAYVHDCAQAPLVDLGTAEFTKNADLDLTIPNDEGAWFIKFHVPGDWDFWSSEDPSEHLMACPDCNDLSQCHPFHGDMPLDGERNVILRLTSTPANPRRMSDTGYSLFMLGYQPRTISVDAGVDAMETDAE